MKRITAALWGAQGALLIVLAGCGSGGGSKPTATTAPVSSHDPTKLGYVGKVLLRDSAGGLITKGSTTPYNPLQTCGTYGCHNSQWSTITSAYHFSQGRTKADGTILISDNFSSKPWILSNGMYGKW